MNESQRESRLECTIHYLSTQLLAWCLAYGRWKQIFLEGRKGNIKVSLGKHRKKGKGGESATGGGHRRGREPRQWPWGTSSHHLSPRIGPHIYVERSEAIINCLGKARRRSLWTRDCGKCPRQLEGQTGQKRENLQQKMFWKNKEKCFHKR